MFVIEVARKVAWSKARQQRKLLSSMLIIWIYKQLVGLFHTMKGAYLGKGYEVTLLSMSIMSHTHKHYIVLQGNRKIVGVEDVVNEDEYNQFDALPPFGEDIIIPTIDDTEEPTYISRDHDEAINVR
jgi:hypothetical protein